ncbi:MAG TPA: hypothetical protein VFZ41_03285 [Solirubrobacterales bacterium]
MLGALGQEGPKAFSDPVGLIFDPFRGDPDRVDPRKLEVLHPNRVALEGGAGSMGFEPVDFHGEPQCGPVCVELIPGDECVHGRAWKPSSLDDRHEEALRAGACEGGIAVDPERRFEACTPGVAAASLQQRVDRGQVKEPEAFRSLKCAFNVASAHLRRQIEKCPRYRRYRDLVAGRVVGLVEDR